MGRGSSDRRWPGCLLAQAGASSWLLVNAASYVAVLAAFAAMRVPVRQTASRDPLAQGLRGGFGTPLAFAYPLDPAAAEPDEPAAMPYTILLPVFATESLEGGASTFGLAVGGSGAGALRRRCAGRARSVLGLGRWIALSPGFFGVLLAAFGLSRSLWLSLPLLAGLGFMLMMHLAASTTILQTIVDEDKRGRVMSLYTMAFIGVAPLGSPLMGILADAYGASTAVDAGGEWLCRRLVGVFVPVAGPARTGSDDHVRLGILPQVAGLQAASELRWPGKAVIPAGERVVMPR